ncbi:MAG: hypothetical protein JWN80_1759 [Microbacteriaceae bacterium]|jgi:hypothetical protein|nr:hypothetical protein [Microbacteriaceae bacterium]
MAVRPECGFANTIDRMSRLFRVPLLVVVAVGASLALAACVGAAAPSPTPTQTKLDPSNEIGQVIDPSGTTWAGTDSAADLSVFTLQPDHTVKVTYGTNTFDEPGDSWSVKAGVLSMSIYIDATNGELNYTGQYDATAKTISATGTTSITSKTITVVLSEK